MEGLLMRILSCEISGAGDIGPTRRALGRALHHRHVADEYVDAVELIASELMTNAIVHGHPPLRLQISLSDEGDIVVAMCDHGAQRPARRDHVVATQPGGYGLKLVEANASSWGYRAIDGGAKEVWAVVPASAPHVHVV
jgi:anti-sigma regulatory factor (Ser/Thr protein kinase)